MTASGAASSVSNGATQRRRPNWSGSQSSIQTRLQSRSGTVSNCGVRPPSASMPAMVSAMASRATSSANSATTRVACHSGMVPGSGSSSGVSPASSSATEVAPRSVNASSIRSAWAGSVWTWTWSQGKRSVSYEIASFFSR
jgi:hypothetical protein